MVRGVLSLIAAAGLFAGMAGCHDYESKSKVKTPSGTVEKKTTVDQDREGNKKIEQKTDVDRKNGPDTKQRSETKYNREGQVTEQHTETK
jgi:hypothetical protein